LAAPRGGCRQASHGLQRNPSAIAARRQRAGGRCGAGPGCAEAGMINEPYECAYQGVLLAGVDEAGRGPLAGAVVAAAVILDPARPIAGLNDSKELTERSGERRVGKGR